MVHVSTLFSAALVVALASAAPLDKRIAQVIADSTTKWETACLAAGGAEQCNPISQTAFTSLLAAGGNCDQQNAADQMVTLAKTLKNNADMIVAAQIFVQQPRNAPDSLSVPYCQTAPKNIELNGLFHCQFSGSDLTKFSGDQTGNLPLGLTAVNPPGSCPAFTSGPVPAAEQLNTLVTTPGTPASAAVAAPAPAASLAVRAASAAVQAQNGQKAQALNAQFASLTATSSCTDGEQACVAGSFSQCVGDKFESTACAPGTQCFALPLVNSAGTSITCATQADALARIAATGNTGGLTGSPALAAREAPAAVQAQNGQKAQALNAQFASLTAASPCTDGEQACVAGSFSQCVGGKFESTACAPGTQCFALPLVNSAGTSITCSTAADASARIAAAGSTGGVTGSAAAAAASPAAAAAPVVAVAVSAAPAAASPAVAAATGAKPFTLQNGKDAQALNAKFASLTASSTCTDGEQACVSGSFAQCSGGKFQVSPCSGGTQCFALPLVNKAGTSVTCDTAADATARIADTGATGGLTGA